MRLPEPFAFYDQEKSSWKTSAPSLFEDSRSSLVTWPKWGTWDLGAAYALPKPGLLINENVGSSLLLTPTANLGDNGGSQHPDKRKDGGHGPTLADQIEHLLPTPTASNPNDGEDLASWEARRQRNKAKNMNGNGNGTPLSIAVRLLPTPTAMDGHGSRNATVNRKEGSTFTSGWTLNDVAYASKWGEYAAAVKRWELLNRSAPTDYQRPAECRFRRMDDGFSRRLDWA